PTLAAAAATEAQIAGSKSGPAGATTGVVASVWEDPLKLKLFAAVVGLSLLSIFLIIKLIKKGKRPAATP
ncbi:MAG: hypothetical protein WD768_15400, partial [Phycisphaeraceae bacterium]